MRCKALPNQTFWTMLLQCKLLVIWNVASHEMTQTKQQAKWNKVQTSASARHTPTILIAHSSRWLLSTGYDGYTLLTTAVAWRQSCSTDNICWSNAFSRGKNFQFLLHDAMYSADYAVERCPSVRPSTRRYSIETAKHIVRLFSPLDSRTILVILYRTI